VIPKPKRSKRAKRKSPRRKSRLALRRVVLGTGHPWFSTRDGGEYTTVTLTRHPVAQSILLREFDWVPIKFSDIGNWNRVRLVIEVLD